MDPAKKLDCVRLKNEIQARVAAEHRGLGEGEVRRRVRRRLATSKSPIAKLWRSLDAAEIRSGR